MKKSRSSSSLDLNKSSIIIDCKSQLLDSLEAAKSGLIGQPSDSRRTEFQYNKNAAFILNMLRDFAVSGCVMGLEAKVKPNDWCRGAKRFNHLNRIIDLCNDAKNVFANETRVLYVTSPAYCFGDIHGNFHDLIKYERKLWPNGPMHVNNRFLFLGDFVDRGIHSVEVILYLFCLKVLAPDKFYLVRGNHEIRLVSLGMGDASMNHHCSRLFGQQNGPALFETVNRAFDCLPFAAVIDNKIFCAHGGIPTSVTRIDQLLSVPCPLPNPDQEAPAVWQLLWNDPISKEDIEELEAKGILNPSEFEGFYHNRKRGTAYYFNQQALDNFLKVNKFRKVIRAHELVLNGYQRQLNDKLITVFSSSKYCGYNNWSACVLVKHSRIQIIKLLTQ